MTPQLGPSVVLITGVMAAGKSTAARVRTRPLYVVVLAPSPEAVRAREVSRPKTGYEAWSVDDLDRALRERTPRIGLWLDTSAQTPAETVAAILGGLPAARV